MGEVSEMLDLVMLIDDDDTTNYLNKRLLNDMQVAREIMVMNNGKEALDYLSMACNGSHSPTYRCPDLIFLDIKMPVMDGFEFLTEYQQLGLDAGDHVIILMLTSSASFYDLERLKGFKKVKKHYSKALTAHDVKEILGEFFKNRVKPS